MAGAQDHRVELTADKLKGEWWGTPLTMTFALLVMGYIVSVLSHSGYGPTSLVPVGIAGGLSVLGFLCGLHSSEKSRAIVTEAFGVTYLESGSSLTQRVHRLADKLKLPRPDVGVMQAGNAFAVGTHPSSSAVVIGLPLIKLLSEDELDAVIGHELGHIATRDVHQLQVAEGYQQMFGTLFGVIVMAVVSAVAKNRQQAQLGFAVSQLGRMTIFLIGELLVKWLSREREFYADAIGANLTSTDAMIRALEKLHGITDTVGTTERTYGHLMFRGAKRGSAFATHPRVESRIQALKNGTYSPWLTPTHPQTPGWNDVMAQAIQIRRQTSIQSLLETLPADRGGQLAASEPLTSPDQLRPRRPRRRKPISRSVWNAGVSAAVIMGIAVGFWFGMGGYRHCWGDLNTCRQNKLQIMNFTFWTNAELMTFVLRGSLRDTDHVAYDVVNSAKRKAASYRITHNLVPSEPCRITLETRTAMYERLDIEFKSPIHWPVRQVEYDFKAIKHMRYDTVPDADEKRLYDLDAQSLQRRPTREPERVVEVSFEGPGVCEVTNLGQHPIRCGPPVLSSAGWTGTVVIRHRTNAPKLIDAFKALKSRECG